ncbi:hypothetical protein EOD42_00735 [Rhodovarius crocodyli]|uniref:DUF5666 domain-containing protein n=1 Tax=Rhodovarius crocodyli TaxID=1979269 RepID=A0A437MLY1_9PROT|nr:DUF5666 domain-containing protein [Rhodovarius crocodyli]RVT98674.1 hypothetical protein EOD42_00735 [Rhodovarius crocodyli]
MSVLLLLANACTERAPQAPLADNGVCRIGPDGGPPERSASGDRGIGGTGIGLADGGDGDRGIGGTGIVGVVTGFASICVNGLHVTYDPALPVLFGDVPGSPAALRVGQVVVIAAGGQEGALRARRVTVRYEVSGPVEALEPGALWVAGQRVVVGAALPGGGDWSVGDVVLVSGLRTPAGVLVASRIDRRPPAAAGTVTIHGILSWRDGVPVLGNLPIRVGPGFPLPGPGPVIASGRLENGVLVPVSVEPDVLLRDPTAWFGPGFGRFLYQGYFNVHAGMVTLGPAMHARAPAGLAPFGTRRGVVELRSGPAGLAASRLSEATGATPTDRPLGGQAPVPGAFRGQRGEPAPVPNRSLERGSMPAGETSGRGTGNSPGDRPGGARLLDSSERPQQPGSFRGGAPPDGRR